MVLEERTARPAGPGYVNNKDAQGNRLRRIEGQVRGLQRMVDADAYCIDILTQVSAATKALEAVALGLLEDHLRHCLAQANDDPAQLDQKVTEASAAVARLIRS
ncbi:metal-sensitive transcriptional regulator [Ornithinimicrobium sufpigmenti]|uniref:metal-sensitive transcriptional regulator n=1 Tax=Ornithinimicrobium sufpigmenti TaxID=2508882 RepID=UPI00103598F8|nr:MULTISPECIES: metal-sensitive transcriptional regulator [unclassified Ornithinimicrobium]